MIAAFAGSKLFKIGLALGACIAFIWALHSLVSAVRKLNSEVYNSGFRAGSDQMEAQWQKASAQNAVAQRDQVLRDAIASNEAVRSYVADIAARKAEVFKVKERTTVYASTPAAGELCLDADGVRLVQDHRAALGIGGQTGAPGSDPGATR